MYIMLLVSKKSLLSAFVRPRPETADSYLPSCKTSSSRLSKNIVDERCHRHVWSSAESNRKPCSSSSLSNNSDILKNIFRSSGANRDRTGNLLVANQALSQLSYSPFDYSISYRATLLELKPVTLAAPPPRSPN